MSEFHCPTCGAVLATPHQRCPFCVEAQRLLQQLADKGEVRLCTRCGVLLEYDQDDLCPTCRKVVAAPPAFWRREDRIAGWIRDHVVEPAAEREGLVCPSCQSSVLPLATFCAHCGYRLAGEPPATALSSEPAAADPDRAEAAVAAADREPAGPARLADSAPAPAGPSWWQETVEWVRDQFRPRGPVVAGPGGPWHERFQRWLHLMFGSVVGDEGGAVWLWIVLGLLIVGIAALAVFWAALLRSGGLVFH